MIPLNEVRLGSLRAYQKTAGVHEIAYVLALRQQLRGLEPWEEIAPLLNEEELSALRDEKNVPLAIQRQMSCCCVIARRGDGSLLCSGGHSITIWMT